MSKNPVRTTALLVSSVAVAAVVLWWSATSEPTPEPWQAATMFGTQARVLDPGPLLRDDGATLSAADFPGHISLLFFGYTQCPDICAPTLALLSGVIREIGDPKLRIAFASMDPERDTPEILHGYLEHLDAPAIGITGTPGHMAQFAANLGAYAQKTPAGDGYLIDHSSAIWIIDTKGRIAGVFTAPLSGPAIMADLRRLLESPA